ncbi:MAG: ABC transporter ATP-binding protein [Candidatus Aminicenantes bacterium]|nr:ABC transporter ATP-binding protein [Candidatus Aminicenantes bacterium]
MSDLAIDVRGLIKEFDGLRAVDGLDLAVAAGEMFGLVGPDGAGKTTTIRLLCGLLEPTAGSVRILGFDFGRDRERIKDRIGYLSQRFSLYGDLTVDENIEFFAEIHRQADFKARREELLAFTRLAPFRDRLADRLSGGMKQKLALACTLVHTPRLLVLDEPTTGVDPVSRRDFWKILSGLLRTGMTIVMTTPYLDEAERCSRVGLLDRGRLLAAGPPASLKALMTGEVVELVTPEPRRARRELEGLAGLREVQLFGDRLNLVADDARAARPAVETALRAAGVPVGDWRVVPPSLENVFISVTRSSTGGGTPWSTKKSPS